MATTKPIKTSRRTNVDTRSLMANQDTVEKGNSTATRTRRVTFSTTPEVYSAVEDAAWERRISRSKLIEDALCEYLNLGSA